LSVWASQRNAAISRQIKKALVFPGFLLFEKYFTVVGLNNVFSFDSV
jgi:hypothetical protein